MMKAQSTSIVGMIIGLLITAVIGVTIFIDVTSSQTSVALDGVAASENHTVEVPVGPSNESFTTNNVGSGLVQVGLVMNESQTFTPVATCGVAGQYMVTLGNGNVTLCDHNDNNSIYIEYNYKDGSYLDGGTTRSIVQIFPVLAAVVVLLIIVSAIVVPRLGGR